MAKRAVPMDPSLTGSRLPFASLLSRRDFLGASAASLGALAFGRGCRDGKGSAARPNILFILTDDQRFDTLGCAGNPIIRTPNVDRLAREGIRFDRAFVTTPICAASRASILTGTFERTHTYTFTKPPLAPAFTDISYPGPPPPGRLPDRIRRQVRRGRRARRSRGDVRLHVFRRPPPRPDDRRRRAAHDRGRRRAGRRIPPRRRARAALLPALVPLGAPRGRRQSQAVFLAAGRGRPLPGRRHPRPRDGGPGVLRGPARLPEEHHEPDALGLAVRHARKVPGPWSRAITG